VLSYSWYQFTPSTPSAFASAIVSSTFSAAWRIVSFHHWFGRVHAYASVSHSSLPPPYSRIRRLASRTPPRKFQ
jgi:hypothetical protein